MTTVIRSKVQAYAALSIPADYSVEEALAFTKQVLQRNHPDRPGGFLHLFHEANAVKQFLTKKPCERCNGLGTIVTKNGRASITNTCEVCNGGFNYR